jgi:cob(I)alamin adenosyltransferase
MIKKGIIQLYTGDGKGKTTAAFGLALRAMGRGLKVTVFQFMKTDETGELLATRSFELMNVIRVNTSPKFTWNMRASELKQLAIETQNGFKEICRIAEAEGCDILILDEINHAIHQQYISKNDILHLFSIKPEHMEIVLTGRNAPEWLIERADLVTEMKCIKHPYNQGFHARIGIEK